jgi:ATP-dependent Clp protease ATP-binding subunit ClpA
MTTNAGAREMAGQSIGFMTNKKDGSMKAVKDLFSPEFRNRLDGIISFNSLEFSVMQQIVDKLILELEARLAEKRVTISLSDKARSWLATKGYDPDYGARPMRRLIMTEIGDRLAEEILFGELKRGGRVLIDKTDEGFDFSYPA